MKIAAFRAVLFAVLLNGCSSGSDRYPAHEPRWSSTPVRVDLSNWGDRWPDLEFAADGTAVAVRWDLTQQAPGGFPLFKVFDTTGRELTEAVAANGLLAEDFRRRFPGFAARSSEGWDRSHLDRKVKPCSAFPGFVNDADAWGVRQDSQQGVRILAADPLVANKRRRSAELWRLEPKPERLWVTRLPETVMDVDLVDLFQRRSSRLVLLAFGGTTAHVFRENDGMLVETFTYGHIETREEGIARKRRFGLEYDDWDPALSFTAHEFSFDSRRRLLACGASYDRRVRIISVDPPYPTVFEANSDDPPNEPKGGVWRIHRVEFAAGGRYLIVEYHFSGRRARFALTPTDIFDTTSWKKVWSENSVDIDDVCLSPDGERIALTRRKVLEIGPFSALK